MLDRILMGSTAKVTDPNFKNVTLLLHGDGSNGAQNNTFIDSSTNNFTITRNGNTTQGSFSPYGDNWSNYFDGTGDYLSVPDSASFSYGTGDFTIECFVFASGLGATRRLYYHITTSSTQVTIYQLNTNYIGFYAANGGSVIVDMLSNTLLPANTWTHIAIVRSGNSFTLYQNGASVATATSSASMPDPSGSVNIGALDTGNEPWLGYISNFRVVKGSAVYTSAFTPPTTPLTAITNTSLLTCQSNRFRDASTNNFTITRNGDTKVTRFSPFAPSAAYSTTTNGGSAYFDGSGDYLSVARNSAFIPTTGDFTIEAWVYPTTSGTTRFIMGLLEQGTAGDWSIFLHTNDTLGFFAGGSDSFGGTVTPFQWNHVAISRSGSTIYKCVNGTATTATFTNSLDSSTGYNLTIGADNAGDEILFQGWMTDARVVKGTAVYTSTTYTVPTAPLSAITNTGFLSKYQNAAIFDNAMQNDLETVGNAQISTSVKKFGTGSIYFDGSGDNLFSPSTQDMDFGTGNWTIEMWVYISSRTTNYPLVFGNNRGSWTTDALALTVSNADSSPNWTDRFVFGWNNGGFSSVSYGTSQLLVANVTNSTGTWYHFAVVRNGTSVKMYRNGTEVASATVSSSATFNWGYNGTLMGGGNWDGAAGNFNGYLDDVRTTKGVARYTANFTAPTAAFPDQ